MTEFEDDVIKDLVDKGAIRWECTACQKNGILLPESKITQYIKSIKEHADKIIFNNCLQHTKPEKD